MFSAGKVGRSHVAFWRPSSQEFQVTHMTIDAGGELNWDVACCSFDSRSQELQDFSIGTRL